MINSTIFNSTDQAGSKALADIQDLIKRKLCIVVDNLFGQHPDGEALMAEVSTDAALLPFLVAHTHALECLELMAQHYAPALDDFFRRHPEAMENDFEPI